jgi:hypothetical protein
MFIAKRPALISSEAEGGALFYPQTVLASQTRNLLKWMLGFDTVYFTLPVSTSSKESLISKNTSAVLVSCDALINQDNCFLP